MQISLAGDLVSDILRYGDDFVACCSCLAYVHARRHQFGWGHEDNLCRRVEDSCCVDRHIAPFQFVVSRTGVKLLKVIDEHLSDDSPLTGKEN